jgi:hypothetical protein
MKDILIKGNSQNIDIDYLKTEFLKHYATKKGWNLFELTEDQINEIKSQKEYTSPIVKS